MFVTHASLNHSLPESVSNSCRHSIWPWLVAHLLFSIYVSCLINGFLYLIGLVLNIRKLYHNPAVQYNHQPTWEEQEMALAYGCRRLNLFLAQLLALIFAYVVGAYCYRSIIRGMPVNGLSFAFWLIEASCDHTFLVALLDGGLHMHRSPSVLNNELNVSKNILLVVKTNQFLMMRYAEFHSRACLSTMLLAMYYHICPKPGGDSTESILPLCFLPEKYAVHVSR